MNAIVKFLIYTGLLFGVLTVLYVFSLTGLGEQVNEISLWLFNALIPLQGIINLPAFYAFLLQLMAFEGLWWSWKLLNKLSVWYTGNTLENGTRKPRN